MDAHLPVTISAGIFNIEPQDAGGKTAAQTRTTGGNKLGISNFKSLSRVGIGGKAQESLPANRP